MGIHFALAGIAEDAPTHVEGARHWVTAKATDPSTPNDIVLIVCYWDGAVSLGDRRIDIHKSKVSGNGGTDANWVTLLAKAFNSSDTDDVVLEMTSTDWGKAVLWGSYRSMQGQ